MSWWRAHLVELRQAFRRRQASEVDVPLPGYSVLGGLITFEIWTYLSLYFCVGSVRIWGLMKVGLSSTNSSPKKRCILARHLLIARIVQVWPHDSQNMSGVYIAPVSKMQPNPGIDFSGASNGVFVSFH